MYCYNITFSHINEYYWVERYGIDNKHVYFSTWLYGLRIFTGSDHITVCPRSSDPFYILSYYIKWVTISWTYSTFFTSRTEMMCRPAMDFDIHDSEV